jgi:hypothetical protein
LFLGDGCDNRYRLVFGTASKKLAYDIFDILLKHNCVVSVMPYLNREIINIRNDRGHFLVMGDRKLPMYRIESPTSQNKELFRFIGFDVKNRDYNMGNRFIFCKTVVYLPVKSDPVRVIG